jgi:hypothetical protein
MAKKKHTKKRQRRRAAAPEQGSTDAAVTPSPDAAAAPVAEPGAGDELERLLGTVTVNRLTIGEVTLSYPSRDVVLTLDGVTAARILAAFADPARCERLQDRLDTGTSSMQNSWITFDLDSLLAVSWTPQLPSTATSRMTVDPPSTTPRPSDSTTAAV